MRTTLFALAALPALLLTQPLRAQDATADMIGPIPRADFNEAIRSYLLENPEVLVEAYEVLQTRQAEQEAQSFVSALNANREWLMRNPQMPVMGNPAGDVTIIQFYDYNCGYCKRAREAIDVVMAEDKNVRMVLVDFPILAESSEIAALAALAAAGQGKYQPLHDALLAHEGPLAEGDVFAHAEKLGLDVAKLREDMAKPELKAMLDRNRTAAGQLNVRGTPAFVIGDKFIGGFIEADQMRAEIAQAREQKG